MPSWGGFEKGVSVGESYHLGAPSELSINSHTQGIFWHMVRLFTSSEY